MIVADSSVWISALQGQPTPAVLALKEASARQLVLVGDVILLEVLQGVRGEKHARFLEANLRVYPVVAMLGDAVAVAAAAHFRQLRSLGITIRKANDLIIATYCIVHGHELLQEDRDFLPLAAHCGLRLA